MMKLYSQEDCDLVFNKLLEELETENDFNLIQNKISKTFGDYFIHSTTLGGNGKEDFRVYRFLSEHSGIKKDPNNPVNYSYNPKPPRGRANLENKPVFYCSFSALTAIQETKELKDETYYISTWKINGNKKVSAFLLLYDSAGRNDFFMDEIDEALNSMTKSLGKQANNFKYQYKKIIDLFTYQGDKYYNISSAIAHKLLYSSRDQGLEVPILIYPSIAKKKIEYNFAIHPAFVDNPDRFELVSIIKCNIIRTNVNKLAGDVFSKAILKDNKLIWGNIHVSILEVDYKNIGLAVGENTNWIFADADEIKVRFYSIEYCLKEYLDDNLYEYVNPEALIDLNEFDIFNAETNYLQEKKLIVSFNSDFRILNFENNHLKSVMLKIKFLFEFK